MAAAKKGPGSATLKIIVDGVRRAKGLLFIDSSALASLSAKLAALEPKQLTAAVVELVQFAQFLKVKQQSPAAGDALLAELEKVVAAKGSGWSKGKGPAGKSKK